LHTQKTENSDFSYPQSEGRDIWHTPWHEGRKYTRKYALEKIVLEDYAEYRDSLKKSGVKDALLDFVA